MKKNEIDEMFARKLAEAEVQPRPEAWVKLQQRMADKKDKPVVLWWQRGAWLAAASVIVVSGALWWNNNTTTNPTQPQMASIQVPVKKIIKETQVAVATEKVTPSPVETIVKKRTEKIENNIKIIENQIVINKKEDIPTPEKAIATPQIINTIPENTIAENTPKVIETPPAAERKVMMTLPEIAETIIAENHNINDKLPTTETASNNKKNSRFTKVFRQLKNFKEGEKVDWNEVGFDPNSVLSKVGKKI